MTLYFRYYRCSRGHEWEDEWDRLCDDRCPVCNESNEPFDYDVVEVAVVTASQTKELNHDPEQ